MVQIAMADGVMANLLMTYETPKPGLVPNDWTRVIGSTGIIEADGYGEVRLGDADGWRVAARQDAFDFLGDYLDPRRLAGFAAQVDDFALAIREGREPVVTGLARNATPAVTRRVGGPSPRPPRCRGPARPGSPSSRRRCRAAR